MNFKNIILFTSVPVILAACLGGGGGAGTNLAAAAVAGLNLPANVEILVDDSALSGNLAAVNMAAYNSTGTDYSKAKAEIWIDGGAWQEPLKQADFLICIMNGTGANLLPNATFKSLVNMSICDDEQSGTQVGKKTRFAEVVVKSLRTSNTAAQSVNAWFLDGDAGSDGVLSEAENRRYMAETVMSTGSSTANPFGVFTFNWNRADAVVDGATGDYERGSLAFTDESTAQVGITFIEQVKDAGNSDDHSIWARGLINKNGSGGKLIVNDGESSLIYKVNFNATHANIDTAGTAVCKNLDESTMTNYVYKYNLYNSTTGALKDIKAGLQFTYGGADAASSTLRGHAGSYVDSSGTARNWIWTQDGSLPSGNLYKEGGGTTTVSIVSGHPIFSSITFDPRVEIDAQWTGVTPAGSSALRSENLDYEGPGQLWGIPWTNTGGVYTPTYNIPNGTSLTDTNSVVWKAKQMGMWKTLATAGSGCASLGFTDAVFSLSAPTLNAVSLTWAAKPTVTGAHQVIHGVLQ